MAPQMGWILVVTALPWLQRLSCPLPLLLALAPVVSAGSPPNSPAALSLPAVQIALTVLPALMTV